MRCTLCQALTPLLLLLLTAGLLVLLIAFVIVVINSLILSCSPQILLDELLHYKEIGKMDAIVA